MRIFHDYAAYYDAIYGDKEYAAESAFVSGTLDAFDPAIHSILDVGCGTGRHAAILAQQYRVIGIDSSRDMLLLAETRRQHLAPAVAENIEFIEADMRDFHLDRTVDAAIALFDTMCYMVEDREVSAVIQSVRRGMKPGGLFLFDFWYGPAVMEAPPSVREKRVRYGDREIVRVAKPTLDRDANCVDVTYEIHSCEESAGEPSLTRETHRVRYFFLPELHHLLTANGFELLRTSRWMSEEPPDATSWNACVVARSIVQ